MLEALWSVSFQSNAQLGPMGGTGVVVFETGRVFGGDSTMIYTGKFRVVNDVIEADIPKRTELWSFDQRVSRSVDKVMPPEHIDRNAFLTKWFFEQASSGLKAKFAPYLDFEKWR
jgi:hypothetical protein